MPPKKKQLGRRQSCGRSHQNICLNQWDEEAMMYAIQEYNSLCVQHGANNVSIKAVAERYQIPRTTFLKRYIPLCRCKLFLNSQLVVHFTIFLFKSFHFFPD